MILRRARALFRSYVSFQGTTILSICVCSAIILLDNTQDSVRCGTMANVVEKEY
jgi:hypothetical protein